MVKLINSDGTIVSVPTKLQEVDSKVLLDMYRSINLPDNYCIITLAQKIKLSQLVLLNNAKIKDTTVYTVPLIGKLPNTHDYKGIINVSDKAILNRTSLELSTHLSINSSVSLNNLFDFITSDVKLKEKCFKKEIADSDGNYDIWIYVLESKILPMNDIRATIPLNAPTIDPFKSVVNINSSVKS